MTRNQQIISVSIVSDFREENSELNIKIFQVRGNKNAAIGRNVGIKNISQSTGYVFFLDGDILFDNVFVSKAISILEKNNEIGTVTGLVNDRISDDIKITRTNTKDETVKEHGGNFIIRKKTLDSVGLFDEKFVKHQDIDFSFRIRSLGYKLMKTSFFLGDHFTVHYFNFKRIYSDLKNFKYVYTGRLFRKYIFSRYSFDMIKCGSILAVGLRFFLLMLFAFSFISKPVLYIFPSCFFLFVIRVKREMGESIAARILSFLSVFEFFLGLLSVNKIKEYTINEL